MTYVTIQDRVLNRLRLTSTTARTRVKARINERIRAAQASVGLGKLRRGTVSVNTASGNPALTTTGLVKVFTVVIPAEARVLTERSLDFLRNLDPNNDNTGVPLYYAVKAVTATAVTLQLYPIPNAIYAVQIDGLLVGSDLSADADVPGMPEDFHDLIIDGVLADEFADQEDKGELVGYHEAKHEKRLRDLRYFLAKSAYLHTRQDGNATDYPWWAVHGNWWV